MQLFVIPGRRKLQRIEICVQVTAHAVCPDQHQRCERNRVLPDELRHLDIGAPVVSAFCLSLVSRLLLDWRPVSIQRVDEVATGLQRPVFRASRSSAPRASLKTASFSSWNAAKKCPPLIGSTELGSVL